MFHSLVKLQNDILACGVKDQTEQKNAVRAVHETLHCVIDQSVVACVAFVLNSAVSCLDRNNHFNIKLTALGVIDTVIDGFVELQPQCLYSLVPVLINGVYDTLTDVKKIVADKGK